MGSNWYAESGTALILDEKETIEFCKKYLKEICERDMVKVPDAYTAVEELGEQALIRSKYKHEQADSSSIEEVDEKHFRISMYEDEMSGGIFTHLNVMSVVEKMIVLNYMGIITVFFSQTNQHCFRKSSKEVIIQWMRSLMNSKKN